MNWSNKRFRRLPRRRILGGTFCALSLCLIALLSSVHAQYTADFQTNIISGVTSNWTGDYLIGSNTAADVLLIQGSGVLFNGNGFLAYELSSSNNSVLVSGTGSIWSNLNQLTVGYFGAGNGLVVSNDGQVVSGSGYLGYNAGSSNNSVLVSGPGSIWTNLSSLTVGYSGSWNSLVISNGGGVYYGDGYVGFSSNSSNNVVRVTDGGFLWQPGLNVSTYGLRLGWEGGGNSLVISSGGKVRDAGWISVVGWGSCSSNNSVLVTGPGSVWSNRYLAVGVSGPGNSLVISNGGQVTIYGRGEITYIGDKASSSNNCILVTGTGSVWNTGSTGLWIGHYSSGNNLVISDGGMVINSNYSSFVGYYGTNNSALVTGSGSAWSNVSVSLRALNNSLVISNGGCVFGDGISQGTNLMFLVTDPGSTWNCSSLSIGYARAIEPSWLQNSLGNSLVITNGGTVASNYGRIGNAYDGGSANSNSVLVSGSGSVWSNSPYSLYVGYYASGNSLTISDGGCVYSSYGAIGYYGTSNRVVVSGNGSVWNSSLNYLDVGYYAGGNSLVVAGGTVLATNLVVGFNSPTCDNILRLDSGSVIVTNPTRTAVLEVNDGSFILNGGVVQADIIVVTNACARFIRNGGTLLYNTLVLDPNMSAVGDGIPNGWKQKYGLDLFDPNLANEDADGDGFTNLQEFRAGTDPTSSASAFRVTDIAQEGDDMRVTWTTGIAKTNALQAAAGDGDSYTNTFADIFTVTNTVGTVTNYLDTGAATNTPARFYRVRLVP